MNSPRRKHRFSCAALLLATSVASASFSQTAPAVGPTAASAADDAVTLSPFTVNAEKDSGYQATDTIVGGRLKTNLLATPSDVSVLTRDFLDDLAATSLVDAGNWLAGSGRAFPNDAGGVDFGAQTNYRGLGSGTDTRNGFRANTTMEAYAVERMEGARGSNAILFGDAPSGGQTNFTTKMARFRNSTQLVATLDSFGSRAVNLDVNRVLTQNLAARVNTQAKQGRTFWDRSHDDRYGANAAVTYRPWQNAEVRFDGGYDYNQSTFQPRFADQISKWDGATVVTGPMTSNPAAATGVSRFTVDKLVWLPSLQHLYNFNSFGQVTGSGLTLVDADEARPARFPAMPRRQFFLSPEDEAYTIRSWTGTLTLSQTFRNGISFELAANRSAVDRTIVNYNLGNTRIDVNALLPRVVNDTVSGYVTNPNFGKRYSEGILNRGKNPQSGDEERATISYEFKRFSWFRQLVGVNAGNRIVWYYPIATGYGRTNGANPDRRNAANQVSMWRYWDEPHLEQNVNYPEAGNDGATIKQYFTRHDTSWVRSQTLQASTVGYYFGDRLTVLAGARREYLRSEGTTIGTYDSFGDVATYTTSAQPTRSTNSSSFGLTFFPIKQVGVYANRGSGFQPGGSSSPLLTGSMIQFSHSVTQSAGIRFRLRDGGIVAHVGYYDSQDENRAVNLLKTNINNIWNAMNHPELQIQSQFSSYADTLQYHGWGTEAEITANLSKQLRLTANASFPRTTQKNARPMTIAYINANRQRWENAAKGLNESGQPLTGSDAISPASQASIASNLPAVYDLITGAAEGRSLDGTFKYRANMFGVFTVPGSRLKGLELGGGANFYGKRQIGNQPNLPFAYVYNEASYTATAFVGYAFKFWRHQAKVQLNVNNLFDWDRPVFSSTTIYQPNTATPLAVYRNAYNYVAPRNYALTFRYDF